MSNITAPAPVFTHEIERDSVPEALAMTIDRAWWMVVESNTDLSNAALNVGTDIERHRTLGHGFNIQTGSGSIANLAAKAATSLAIYDALIRAVATVATFKVAR